MRVELHKEFERRYSKLPPKVKTKTNQRLNLFTRDPFDPMLNNHALKGKYLGYRSINVTGDYRAIYKLIGEDLAFFVTIGAHSNLYK